MLDLSGATSLGVAGLAALADALASSATSSGRSAFWSALFSIFNPIELTHVACLRHSIPCNVRSKYTRTVAFANRCDTNATGGQQALSALVLRGVGVGGANDNDRMIIDGWID